MSFEPIPVVCTDDVTGRLTTSMSSWHVFNQSMSLFVLIYWLVYLICLCWSLSPMFALRIPSFVEWANCIPPLFWLLGHLLLQHLRWLPLLLHWWHLLLLGVSTTPTVTVTATCFSSATSRRTRDARALAAMTSQDLAGAPMQRSTRRCSLYFAASPPQLRLVLLLRYHHLLPQV